MKVLRIPVLFLCLLPAACIQTVAVREPAEAPLRSEQVASMLMAGLSDNVILAKANRAGVATLSPENLEALKAAGANEWLLGRLVELERHPMVYRSRSYHHGHYGGCYHCGSHSCWGCGSYYSWRPSIWMGWGFGYYGSRYRVRRAGISIGW